MASAMTDPAHPLIAVTEDGQYYWQFDSVIIAPTDESPDDYDLAGGDPPA